MNAADGTDPLPGCGLVLAAEPGGSQALSRAYARYLAGCCQKFLRIGPRLPGALRPVHERSAALVRQALAARRRGLLHCFASPAVGTPLRCFEQRDELPAFRERIDQAAAAAIPHLLLEMALRGLLPEGEAVTWEHGAPRLASISIGGELIAPPGATGLRFSAGHIAAVRNGTEVARLPVNREGLAAALARNSSGFRFERRYRRIGNITHFSTVDHNPIAAFETHPDKAGNHIDLGGCPEDQWIGVLDQCFALIERFLPGEHAEMAVMLRELIPVGYDHVRHLSASYREAVGTVYLTLHPDVMTMTEAVVHEFQHSKLNVSSYGTDYLVNAFHPLYKSPVRPDPRPLWGILLAVHAFLPVAELYRRMRDASHPLAASPEFERRLSDIDLKNHEGMEMLRANAEPTEAGQALLDELEAIERRHLAERAARGLSNTPVAAHLS